MIDTRNIIAILCSDIHLSTKPPLARSDEPDWFAAMLRGLDQLKELQQQHQCPIICAGDVFDRWNPNPSLINFAIEHLPKMHAIPGQHDLPNHRYQDIRHSAYWTLVEAGTIHNLDPHTPNPVSIDLVVHACPWGFPINPCDVQTTDPSAIHLLVAHRYLWIQSHGYHTAPKEQRLSALRNVITTYNAAHFGDNHQGFITRLVETAVINTGTFFRRKTDEVGYKPRVGLLNQYGRIKNHYLDTSSDILLTHPQTLEKTEDFQLDDFLASLDQLSADPLDFLGILHEKLPCLPAQSQALLRRILQHVGTT